jgi:hypothetical protein
MPAAIIQSSGHIRHAGKEPENRIAKVVLPLPGSPVSTTSRPIPPAIMSPPNPCFTHDARRASARATLYFVQASAAQGHERYSNALMLRSLHPMQELVAHPCRLRQHRRRTASNRAKRVPCPHPRTFPAGTACNANAHGSDFRAASCCRLAAFRRIPQWVFKCVLQVCTPSVCSKSVLQVCARVGAQIGPQWLLRWVSQPGAKAMRRCRPIVPPLGEVLGQWRRSAMMAAGVPPAPIGAMG